MADNVGYTPGSGATVAADEIGGVLFQRVKPTFGNDGEAVDVSANNPMPVGAVGELMETIQALRIAIQSLTRSIGQTLPDTSGRLRANVETGSVAISSGTVTTVSTVTTCSTVTTLSNQTQIGSFSASEQIPALLSMAAASIRRNITVT
jgi:hypothetical protein